jgi:hypothetical protein
LNEVGRRNWARITSWLRHAVIKVGPALPSPMTSGTRNFGRGPAHPGIFLPHPAAVEVPSASRSSGADWPKQQCSATTNDPLSTRTDRNTAAGRRIADLYRAYIAAMGGPTDTILQANALAAAELKVAAEDVRKRMLGGGGDADQLVRLENLAPARNASSALSPAPAQNRRRSPSTSPPARRKRPLHRQWRPHICAALTGKRDKRGCPEAWRGLMRALVTMRDALGDEAPACK